MSQKNRLKVALVVPHIFLHRDILPNVIFAPGSLSIVLAEGLANYDIDVSLFTPGPVDTTVQNINADMGYFEQELAGRGDTYIDLLKKHPFIFITLARQLQSELIAKAYEMANDGKFDLVHIYTNEEDIALPFAKLCNKPVVFTHHDPFNFLVKYKNNFPKYPHLNWLSISMNQRKCMPKNTNWIDNIYHGLDPNDFKPAETPEGDYVAYLGRIIQPKGVHLAIKAVRKYNETAKSPLKLKIAGKHYADESSDDYWQTTIEPELDDTIQYVGLIKDLKKKSEFLSNARALMVPSIFEEPFGMVIIESLASGTPVIGLESGAIPEIIDGKNGIVVEKDVSENKMVARLALAIKKIGQIDRKNCRSDFERRFTTDRMCQQHAEAYKNLTK
ncbi:MAG TPA: glycosyltransferase [Candidatus Saccharimonadales bacterium]|nr:glycosyltransferase [Candidatus Saccharimonadales bacterium]